jgi:wyosine [tRNA(Phe)-imidazoG37] synthetase (radical SAM superfamily)
LFDVGFFMRVTPLRKRLESGECIPPDVVLEELEALRDPRPVVYNIETTNACNMRCRMCPRTTMMSRPVEALEAATFRHVVDQLTPVDPIRWSQWTAFAESEYGVGPHTPSENHFFLYVIPRVIQLHGYGDPLLDPHLADHVALLTERGFDSYFSCNPANIDRVATERMMENGLTWIKYSVESTDDERFRSIRGERSNFTQSYRDIEHLLDMKARRGLGTTVVITMLDLNFPDQQSEYERLRAAFAGKDVYLYLKSEDQQWYREDYHGTQSIHWRELCKHPWMSMTVKSNGELAMCMEDFDNEIVLGDARREPLERIWNGAAYARFRRDHVLATPGIKCTAQCDMPVAGELLAASGETT